MARRFLGFSSHALLFALFLLGLLGVDSESAPVPAVRVLLMVTSAHDTGSNDNLVAFALDALPKGTAVAASAALVATVRAAVLGETEPHEAELALAAAVAVVPAGGVLVLPASPHARPPVWQLEALLRSAVPGFRHGHLMTFVLLEGAGPARRGSGIENMRRAQDHLASLTVQVLGILPHGLSCAEPRERDAALRAFVTGDGLPEAGKKWLQTLTSLRRNAMAAALARRASTPSSLTRADDGVVRAYAHLLMACERAAGGDAGEAAGSLAAEELEMSNHQELFQSPFPEERARRQAARAFVESHPQLLELATPPLVPKTQLSGSPRWVAIAGLEGTGHHGWNALFSSACVMPKCGVTPEIAETVGALWYSTPSMNAPLEGAQLTEVATRMHDLMSLSAQERSMQRIPERMVVINTAAQNVEGNMRGVGMMSYPNGGPHTGLDPSQRHPDLPVLAALGEGAGADVRLLVLLRSPLDSVLSTSVHRSFGSIRYQLAKLTHEALVLLEQLRTIDPRFYVCWDMDTAAQDVCGLIADALGWPFTGPKANLCQLLQEMHATTSASRKNETLDAEYMPAFVTFYRADAALREMCRRAHSIADSARSMV